MSLDDFFTKGLRDAERRLPLLKPLRAEDQEEIATIVRSSRSFRFVDRIMDLVTRTGETSVAVNQLRAMWRESAPAERRLFGGVVLIVASLLHVGLVAWHEAPPGWLWLILPGVAMAWSAILVMFASMERREHG